MLMLGAAEQNLLKLFEALIDDRPSGIPSVPVSLQNKGFVVY